MTEFVFNLSRFSFKRKGWENPLQVDISETRCAVLTGLNASGKTLVMRSLERFCDAMMPSDGTINYHITTIMLKLGKKSYIQPILTKLRNYESPQ